MIILEATELSGNIKGTVRKSTIMLRNKANIRHIQELLGHASLNSTQGYTSVSITDLKEVHSKCHTRERDKE